MRPFTCRQPLLLTLTTIACSQSPQTECRLNSDCPSPQICAGGLCAPECREDRDCLDSEQCSEGRCIERGPMTKLCISSSECPAGHTCMEGVCQVVSLVGRDAGPMSSPDAGFAMDLGPSSDAGAAGLPYGAVCARGSECSSGLCLGPQGAPAGRCTAACVDDSQCFYPDTCTEVQGAGRFCAQGAGAPAGAPCPGGPTECASGLCITLQSGDAICTQACSPLPACPAGLVCVPVADGMGGALALCAPGQGGGFGQACAAASQCASGICVGVPGQTGQCSALCNQVPCPSGYDCVPVDDGAGGQVPVCGPAGASGGQFGDACAGASGCANGLCLNDARTGQAFCTQPCVSAADCAQIPGLTCVVLEPGVQVCGPPL